jgi:hypothetical protein
MALRYISERRTVFHPDAQTGTQEFVLIYGDEVDTTLRSHKMDVLRSCIGTVSVGSVRIT